MILICGASGLVGKEMCCFLDEQKIDYIGTFNKNKIDKKNMYEIDFSNPLLLEKFLEKHKITCCIYCIVERLTDVCENKWNEIKKTNIDLVNIISFLCNKLDINLIHLSTDYVFDGSIQPNYPESLKNPLQNYGISKLISEYRIESNCLNRKYCIIRTPVLYSALSKVHDNAISLIGKNVMDLRKNKNVNEDNYCIRRPLYISDLCKFIYDCYDQNLKGIYHFYNPYNKFTKYEISKIIANFLCINIENIIPNNNKSEGFAPRPFDTQLIDYKFEINNYSFKDFNKSIEECFSKFKHENISLKNKSDYFICLDLDGTIIESNLAHYNAYKKVFEKYNLSFLNFEEWNNIILNDSFTKVYLDKQFDETISNKIKKEKIDNLKEEAICFTKNSEVFLKFLINNKFNFCVVTNTNRETIEIFKEKLPLLKLINNWICREDYNLPKPNDECYQLAKQNYYKNEKYILGFEDSMVGYKSLKSITDLIYIYNNESLFKNNDCYLFDDFKQII